MVKKNSLDIIEKKGTIMSFCLVTFISKHDRFRAEELFRNHGFTYDLIPPPVRIRTNSDYAFRFDAQLKEQIEMLFTRYEMRIEQWITNSEFPLTLADLLKQHLIIEGNLK